MHCDEVDASRAVIVTTAVVALFAVACASTPSASWFPPPLVRSSSVPMTDAARSSALRDRWARYEQSTGDFSATVRVRYVDPRSGQYFTSSGALAVRRPDRARMQLAGPGGITAIDVLVLGSRSYTNVGGRGWIVRDGHRPTATRGFDGTSVARALVETPAPGEGIMLDGARPIVRVTRGDGRTEHTLDSSDGAVQEVRWFDSGDRESLRVRFDSFERLPTGERRPAHVSLWQREPAAIVTITIDAWTASPQLPAATFAPPDVAMDSPPHR